MSQAHLPVLISYFRTYKYLYHGFTQYLSQPPQLFFLLASTGFGCHHSFKFRRAGDSSIHFSTTLSMFLERQHLESSKTITWASQGELHSLAYLPTQSSVFPFLPYRGDVFLYVMCPLFSEWSYNVDMTRQGGSLASACSLKRFSSERDMALKKRFWILQVCFCWLAWMHLAVFCSDSCSDLWLQLSMVWRWYHIQLRQMHGTKPPTLQLLWLQLH